MKARMRNALLPSAGYARSSIPGPRNSYGLTPTSTFATPSTRIGFTNSRWEAEGTLAAIGTGPLTRFWVDGKSQGLVVGPAACPSALGMAAYFLQTFS